MSPIGVHFLPTHRLGKMVELRYNGVVINQIVDRGATGIAHGLSNRNGASVTMSQYTPRPAFLKPCAICGAEFSTTNANYKYCSPECRAIGYTIKSNESSRRSRQRNPERRREIQRASRQRNLESARQYGREWMQRWRDANPEASRAILRASYARNADKWREYQKQYRAAHAERTNAQQAVKFAVKRGDLPAVTTLACVRCGNPATAYHHWSYDRENWLNVEAMCFKCHKAADTERAAMEAQ